MDLGQAGLEYAVDGAVATITLNRPDVRNAQHPAMWAGMVELLSSVDDEVRIVVVRGAGGTFSAGLDLSLLGTMVGLAAQSDEEIIDTIDTYQRPFAMLADPRFISVAVVDGYAIGAGFQLALACDVRIVAEDATFCMKEPALGLVPDLAGTKPLVEAVGYARALEICATARMVPANEAAELGIAQAVVPPDQLDATLETMVTQLTAHSAGAVRATKQLLQQAHAHSLDEQRLAERTAQAGRFRELAALVT